MIASATQNFIPKSIMIMIRISTNCQAKRYPKLMFFVYLGLPSPMVCLGPLLHSQTPQRALKDRLLLVHPGTTQEILTVSLQVSASGPKDNAEGKTIALHLYNTI